MSPRRDEYGRLNVELRLLGAVSLAWVLVVGVSAIWAWVTALPFSGRGEFHWGWLLVPPSVAIVLILGTLVRRLPAARWPRRGSLVHLPNPAYLLILGLPAILFVPYLAARDRKARTQTPDADTAEQAFQTLVGLPLTAAMLFVSWMTVAAVADAVLLGIKLDWTRAPVVAIAIAWISLLGPSAALLNGRARAILRPEYLTAPRRTDRPFRRLTDLRLRLAVTASLASMGAVAGPLAAGYLWMRGLTSTDAIEQAQGIADGMIRQARAGELEALGRDLVANPQVTLRDGTKTYGPDTPIPATEGPRDLDGDGNFDVLVVHDKNVAVLVPLAPTRSLPLPLILMGAALCLTSAVSSVLLITRDVRRDVVRASDQVLAVARGQAPPPMTEASFSTREIRQLVQSVDRLVNRITEANVAKYVAIETAKEADRLKSQFLANMSHDLRSPLNSILGFSELLLTGIEGKLTEPQRDSIQSIYANGRDLLHQIDDILDTAKIEASRMEVHCEPTPPATLVTRAIQSAKKRAERPIEYESKVAAGMSPAFVDPYRTVQAIENVLLFASERMPSGKLFVSVKQGLAETGRVIFIEVHTPVRPATAEDLTRALKGFHRIPGHRGLGLGLPIAGSILELEGGSLSIEDMGDEMMFTMQLPAPESRRALRLRSSDSHH